MGNVLPFRNCLSTSKTQKIIKSYLFSNLENKNHSDDLQIQFQGLRFLSKKFASLKFMVATSKNKKFRFLRFCNILRGPLISGGTLWKMEKFDLAALISSKQNRRFSARYKFTL